MTAEVLAVKTPVSTLLWKRLKYALYSLFVVLTDVYGIATCILLALKLLMGESSWVVAMFNSLFPAVLIPALLMLPASLLIRRWRLAAQVLPALAIFVVQYGFYFLPRAVAYDSANPQLSILTYNTHSERTRHDSMVALIREANADIVVLQEFVVPAADRFDAEFAEDYPYRALEPVGLSVYGKGILSRYPILSVRYDEDERMTFQRIELNVKETRVVVYNFHPSIPRWMPPYNNVNRSYDITRILEDAAPETAPLLIAGDFNLTDQSDDYRLITSRYIDTYREVGRGLGVTYPDFTFFGNPILATLPQIIRLDYVFHSEHFDSIEAYAWHTSGGSDHHPLFARLALAEND
jgi:endonuclease/exonuclease/phosphatase (EEP) superfamily protein YafD